MWIVPALLFIIFSRKEINMQVLDIRNTQSCGLVADVMLSPNSILPVSLPIAEVSLSDLMDYTFEIDELNREWKETYQSLL